MVTNLCLKDLVARIRPYDSVEGLVPLVARLKDYSFPSGHTCASFACAGVYYKAFPGKWGKSSHGPGSTDRFVPIVRGEYTILQMCWLEPL
ncbi:MAG: phosphatase PAP2 family protein [Ruminococcus sp.]